MRALAWSSGSDKLRVLSVLAWAVLLSVQCIESWVMQVPVIIVLAKVVPLLMFLPGIIRDNLRSYIWLCFVSLLYFLVLVQRLFAQPGSVLAIAGMIAVVTLFVSAMLYVRWRARELRDS